MEETKRWYNTEPEYFQSLLEQARQVYSDITGEALDSEAEYLVSQLVTSVVATNEACQRERYRQRQKKGIAEAKKRGTHMGRPLCPVPPNFRELVCAWEEKRLSTRDILQRTGFSQATFYRRLRELRQS